MTVIDDLNARIAALEKRGISLDDLPLAQLQRRLEQRWLGDAMTSAATQRFDVGVAEVTWPGGTPDATSVIVGHGLDLVPRGVVVTGGTDTATYWNVAVVGAFTVTSFALSVRNVVATPGIGETASFYWLAFA